MKYCPLLNCKVLYIDCNDCTIEEKRKCRSMGLNHENFTTTLEENTRIITLKHTEPDKLKKKYNKAVIGIDQSYTNTGISIAIDGKLVKVTSTKYFKDCPCKHKGQEVMNGKGRMIKVGKPSHTEKRQYVVDKVEAALKLCTERADETIIIVERMRTYSKDNNQSARYIKATASLIACIVDIAFKYDVPVYSVDTRSWKSVVIGDSRPKHNKLGLSPEKYATVAYVCNVLGFKSSIIGRNKQNKLTFDDDAADSACIALYGFAPKEKQKLLREE